MKAWQGVNCSVSGQTKKIHPGADLDFSGCFRNLSRVSVHFVESRRQPQNGHLSENFSNSEKSKSALGELFTFGRNANNHSLPYFHERPKK